MARSALKNLHRLATADARAWVAGALLMWTVALLVGCSSSEHMTQNLFPEKESSIQVTSGSSSLPTFPWPPPAASSSYVLPKKFFASLSTIGEVAYAIEVALDKNGYVEQSFYQTENDGVVLVTRLERINDDGTVIKSDDRWPPGFKSTNSSLAAFLRGLFFVDPGRYRVIVFVLQEQPFTQSGEQVSGDQARQWLVAGGNTLPRPLAERQFGQSVCTVLVYEFQSDGKAVKLVDGRLPGKTHLEKAGLLAALSRTK